MALRMARFVLASASPRRRDLLAQVGLQPEIVPSHVDETPRVGELPLVYVARVAKDKALAYAGSGPVLAADTVVALDDRCLGKADDKDHACRMLRELSGRTHFVHTAVVLKAGQDVLTEVVSTEVSFRDLGDEEIERYVDSGEPMDKAGAYGIQGLGGALVASLKGSYTNVVGLPLQETLVLLKRGGVR